MLSCTKNKGTEVDVELLSIPNFWMPYYIHGLATHPRVRLRLRPDPVYRSYNFLNRCVLRISCNGRQQLIMLDLDDPTDRHLTYHDRFDYIFLSQKRMDWTYPSPEKYHALYPHFPVRSFEMFTLQGLYMFHPSRFIRNLKEFRAICRQKPLWLTSLKVKTTVEPGFLFYKRALWKNLAEVNMLGALFLDVGKRLGFQVEGGLSRMSDDFRTGIEQIDKYVTKERLTRSDYIKKTLKSEVCFNTPSINGACSWRLGEYLAMDKVIISTPMKVELPTEIKYLEVSDDPVLFEEQVEHLLKNPDTFKQISNREFFERKLRPVAQIDYILEKIGCK